MNGPGKGGVGGVSAVGLSSLGRRQPGSHGRMSFRDEGDLWKGGQRIGWCAILGFGVSCRRMVMVSNGQA